MKDEEFARKYGVDAAKVSASSVDDYESVDGYAFLGSDKAALRVPFGRVITASCHIARRRLDPRRINFRDIPREET